MCSVFNLHVSVVQSAIKYVSPGKSSVASFLYACVKMAVCTSDSPSYAAPEVARVHGLSFGLSSCLVCVQSVFPDAPQYVYFIQIISNLL